MAILGSFLRKLNTFKQEDTGIERYPIFRNKNSHPSEYYMDVVIPDNIPQDYQKEICNVRINRYKYVTVNCGQGGYSQTYDIWYEIQIVFGRQPWRASYWDMNRGASSYQVIVKSGYGDKLAVFEPDYEFDGSFYAFAHFTSESDISSKKPRYFYIDGTRYDFGASTYNGDYIVVNGSVQADTRKTLTSPTDEGYVLLNDWSALDPSNPQPTIGYIPLSSDPALLAVYKDRVLYPNKNDAIRCQGCDNGNSDCTYCDGLTWYGGDCGTCNIVCYSGDECPDCYKVVDTETIEVCDQCHDVTDEEEITHEEEVEKEPETVPTTCVVEGSTVDEGDGAIGYCFSGCVGCDGCNGPCNEEFTPAVTEINCKGTADQTCTGAACTSEQTATEEKSGTCPSCNIFTDDVSELEKEIDDPEKCVANQTNSTLCIMIDGRCTGIGNKATCEGEVYSACSGVDTKVRCEGGEYHSGLNTDYVVTCTDVYITDGGKIVCKPEYIQNIDTEQGNVKTTKTVRCAPIFERGDGKVLCSGQSYSEVEVNKKKDTGEVISQTDTNCSGGTYTHCPGTNDMCSGQSYSDRQTDGTYIWCIGGEFAINDETEEISCIPQWEMGGKNQCPSGCFGSAHGTWTQCVGAACTAGQTEKAECGVVQAGTEVETTCKSDDGGSATCEGGIHGVCTGVDYDDEYCSGGVYIPVCKGGATISCDPCYLVSYGTPGCPQYGQCTPCRNGDSCPACFTTADCPSGDADPPPPPCEHCPDHQICDYNPCEYGSCSPCRICYGLSCSSCRSGDYCMSGD